LQSPAGALERLAAHSAEGFPNLLAARERTAARLAEMRLRVAPVAAADEGALLYESDCEESLWALARAAGIDFEEERCDPLALLWSLRGQYLPD